MEFGIYIPQVGLAFDEILARARRCEALGFTSFWLYDHLYAPGLPDQPSLEAWTLATALLAHTTTLRVGHLVLNNNLRHPALLAKMATTLDLISGGRFELGLGSGSYEPEHAEGGFPWGSMRERSSRLAEALEILTRMFAGAPTTFTGHHYQVHDLPNVPAPLTIPRPRIHVGGAGERFTLPLVARYADVWNVPTYALDRWHDKVASLETECARIGRDPATIKRSLEAVLVTASAPSGLRDAVAAAERRYGGPGWGLQEGGFVGEPAALVERIRAEAERGVTLFVFFPSDRGRGETIDVFAEQVMPQFTQAPS